MTGADVVAAARVWLDTPHHWQQSTRGQGCDCKGLIAGVARDLGRPEADSVFAQMNRYGSDVDERLLRRGLRALFDRVPTPALGDVLLLRFGGKAQHLGIYAGETLIHSYGASRRPRVLETSIAAALRAWPLVAVWRWKGLE